MSRPHTPGLNIRRTQLDTSSLNLTSLTASSSNPGISRIGTPSSFRNVISLEEWESKAPLSIEQLQSISLVKEKFGERPFPEKVRKPLLTKSKHACPDSWYSMDKLIYTT